MKLVLSVIASNVALCKRAQLHPLFLFPSNVSYCMNCRLRLNVCIEVVFFFVFFYQAVLLRAPYISQFPQDETHQLLCFDISRTFVCECFSYLSSSSLLFVNDFLCICAPERLHSPPPHHLLEVCSTEDISSKLCVLSSISYIQFFK